MPRGEIVDVGAPGRSSALDTTVYYGFAREIILAFDHEPAVLAAAEPFVKLMALSFLFSGPMFPLVSAMNGAGDTKPPMVVAFLSSWLLKLPLAYCLALPLGWGVNGVWIGIFVSVIFETLATAWWYRRGTWLTPFAVLPLRLRASAVEFFVQSRLV